ncbi:MAG: ABC transporter ATP-binding protein [Chloroflexi bacterium]|nr:ABC transporter ATP-binding protein [Chloroflexota bacterium]
MTTASVAAEPVIRVSDLRKAYGATRAVDGVSFEVRRGEGFGLLGPNGAGKTTTVEILEGLRRQDSGEATVLGIDVARHPDALKARIGVALQTAALYPKLTVTEVIDLFRSFYGRGRATGELIGLLDLGEKSATQTRQLSGGQRQRLAVALSLVNDPELIFLDEPTTGMDPAARRSLWDLVLALKAEGRTIVLTTHYMEEAEVLCDRLAIMDHGRILESGTVTQLIDSRFHERAVRFERIAELDEKRMAAFPGVTSVRGEDRRVLLYTRDVPATIGAVLTAAEALGEEPQDLAVRRATLEDVFLDLTGRALRD